MDFSSVVLAPCQDAFSIPVTIDPRRSQRTAPVPYTARGILTKRVLDVVDAGGSVLSDAVVTLGIRLAEYAIPPVAQDYVIVNGVEFFIDDIDDDGQGLRVLTIRRTMEST